MDPKGAGAGLLVFEDDSEHDEKTFSRQPSLGMTSSASVSDLVAGRRTAAARSDGGGRGSGSSGNSGNASSSNNQRRSPTATTATTSNTNYGDDNHQSNSGGDGRRRRHHQAPPPTKTGQFGMRLRQPQQQQQTQLTSSGSSSTGAVRPPRRYGFDGQVETEDGPRHGDATSTAYHPPARLEDLPTGPLYPKVDVPRPRPYEQGWIPPLSERPPSRFFSITNLLLPPREQDFITDMGGMVAMAEATTTTPTTVTTTASGQIGRYQSPEHSGDTEGATRPRNPKHAHNQRRPSFHDEEEEEKESIFHPSANGGGGGDPTSSRRQGWLQNLHGSQRWLLPSLGGSRIWPRPHNNNHQHLSEAVSGPQYSHSNQPTDGTYNLNYIYNHIHTNDNHNHNNNNSGEPSESQRSQRTSGGARSLEVVEAVMLSAAANLQGPSLLQHGTASRPGRRRPHDMKKPPPPPPEAAPFGDSRQETEPDNEGGSVPAPAPSAVAPTRKPAPAPAPSTAPTYPNTYQTRPDDDEKGTVAPSVGPATTTTTNVATAATTGAARKTKRAPRYLYPDDDTTVDGRDTEYDDDEKKQYGSYGATSIAASHAVPATSSGGYNDSSSNDYSGNNSSGGMYQTPPASFSLAAGPTTTTTTSTPTTTPGNYSSDPSYDERSQPLPTVPHLLPRQRQTQTQIPRRRQPQSPSPKSFLQPWEFSSDVSTSVTSSFIVDGDNSTANHNTNHSEIVFEEVYYELYELCQDAGRLEADVQLSAEDYQRHDLSWNPVRDWLQTHSTEQILTSMEFRDVHGQTALHVACQHQPPMDIMSYLLQTSASARSWTTKFVGQSGFGSGVVGGGNTGSSPQGPQQHLAILESQDMSGRTPLHYACAYAPAPPVLQLIAEYWPAAKLKQTDKGMTPLHLALIGPFRESPNLIATLASTGACQVKEDNGLLPLHYACAYGASEDTLRVIIAQYEQALTASANFGHYPLHFALANTKIAPQAAPVTVKLLLRLDPNSVNQEQQGTPHPIEFFEEIASSLSGGPTSDDPTPIKESLNKCLDVLLEAKPKVTPRVIDALQRLRSFFFRKAILSPHIQDSLNEKIKGKFPVVILMFDLYVQIAVLVFYHRVITESLNKRFDVSDVHGRNLTNQKVAVRDGQLIPLYFGAIYFVLREVIQAVTLISLGRSFKKLLSTWIFRPTDMLDFTYIGVVFFWVVVVHSGLIEKHETFRNWAALSAFVLWAKFFLFMRSMSVDFSIFVTGFFYVAIRLIPYMIGLVCFFLAFMQIFYTIFLQADGYGCDVFGGDLSDPDFLAEYQCSIEDDYNAFCTRWSAFLRVYTMFLGEVDQRDFASSTVATVYFAIFMFLMVLLLANVLIAIVTNAYKIIQDDEAEVVFYSDRLNFLAETEVFRNCPVGDVLFCGGSRTVDDVFRDAWKVSDEWLYRSWKQMFLNFELGPDERLCDHTFWTFHLARMLFSICAIPVWFLLGFVTFGVVWPPQVREWLFTSNMKRTLAQRESEFRETRRQEENRLDKQLTGTREQFFEGLAETRQHIAQTRAVMTSLRQDLRKGHYQIKIIVNNLWQQADENRDIN